MSRKLNGLLPVFPSWNDVIETIFCSPVFQKVGLNRENLNLFQKQIQVLKLKTTTVMVEPLELFNTVEKIACKNRVEEKRIDSNLTIKHQHPSWENTFYSLGSSTGSNFEYVDANVAKILELPSDAHFNLGAIFGQDKQFELYHPEDVLHSIRFGLAAFLMTSLKGVEWNPHEDYFKISFRIGFDTDSRKMVLHRKSFLYDWNRENGTRFLSQWKVEKGHDDFNGVSVKIMTQNPEMNTLLKNLFFLTNCYLLRLEPRDVIMAKMICNYSVKEIPGELNKYCKENNGAMLGHFTNASCHNIKSKLTKKVAERAVEYTKGCQYKQQVQRRSFYFHCRQLGILNMPHLLEKSIWKEVETRL